MTFSQMFTGLRARLLSGKGEQEKNMIDPMDIWPTWHDRYPKVELKNRHLWDLHPLGSETSLTSHGAEYVFVGVADVSGSSTLDADSAFFDALCSGGSKCTNAALVALNETLPCTGKNAAVVSCT